MTEAISDSRFIYRSFSIDRSPRPDLLVGTPAYVIKDYGLAGAMTRVGLF